MKLGIIGGGRAAWAFGSKWRRIGWPISGIALRSDGPISTLLKAPKRTVAELAADSELILIAVSDRAIAEVATSIPRTNAILFHPSGIATSVRGGFSLHPFKALSAGAGGLHFQCGPFCVRRVHRRHAQPRPLPGSPPFSPIH